MAFSLKTLFTSKKAQPTPATLPVVGQQQPPVNANDRRQGETYQNWGMRMCATVGGSNFALVPMLQKAYQDEYNAQAQNVQLQQQTRANLQAQVEQEKNNKQLLQQQIEQANQKINDNNTAIDRAKEAINRLKEELQKQQEQHELLETKIAELERQIDKIKNNDPEEIERIARDRRGYSRPGEVIYQLELPEPSATTTTPSTP